MRVFWSWMVPAAFVIVSCGGKVVLDGSSGVGGSGTGTSTGGMGGVGSVIGAGAAGAIGAAGGVGTGGDCVATCAQALAQGGVPCNGTAAGNYQSLQLCAGCSDTGNCEGVCGATLCGALASSAACTMCVATSCEMEYVACEHS